MGGKGSQRSPIVEMRDRGPDRGGGRSGGNGERRKGEETRRSSNSYVAYSNITYSYITKGPELLRRERSQRPRPNRSRRYYRILPQPPRNWKDPTCGFRFPTVGPTSIEQGPLILRPTHTHSTRGGTRANVSPTRSTHGVGVPFQRGHPLATPTVPHTRTDTLSIKRSHD